MFNLFKKKSKLDTDFTALCNKALTNKTHTARHYWDLVKYDPKTKEYFYINLKGVKIDDNFK